MRIGPVPHGRAGAGVRVLAVSEPQVFLDLRAERPADTPDGKESR
ncbi:hypothetical protein ATKI12_4407 [Kitasatospora sp. Ki12]